MYPPLHRRSPLLAGLLVAALVSSACVGGDDLPEVPDAAAAADAFIEAWNASDEEALGGYASTSEVESFLLTADAVVDDGLITDVEVRRAGDVIQPTPTEPSPPTPATTDVDYAIAYTSEASIAAVVLEGSFEMAYDYGEGAWTVDLAPDLLWPGIEGAAGFDVDYKWLLRGTIVDRDGRVLAKGQARSRTYPQGTVAGSVIGHIGVLTRADVKDGATGERGDLVGASGLEELFQERLAGEPTLVLKAVDDRGRPIRTLGRSLGRPGKKVRSTLDVEVQRAAQAAYGSILGGAVVLDPATGDVLAVADAAPFGPANYVGAKNIEPFNRALSGRYPPGSSMKIVTAAAALDSETVKSSTTVTGPKEYKGVRNFESGEFGSIPFATAVKFSVNTAFAQVAEDLGGKKLTRYAEAFGFNREPRIQAGLSSFPRPEDLGDLMWSSVGQAQVLATPLQMASVAATVANGGVRMEPRLAMHQPTEGTRVIGKGVASTLAGLLESVVQGGTGTGARIAGVRVAGKTGTAEVDVGGERKNHAWFAAFAPVGAPKVAVAAVAELGGIGGQVAAPLVRSIILSVLGRV